MTGIATQEYHDCTPTLTDTEVLDFCRNGFMMLEGVVPDEINQKTLEYCDHNVDHGTRPQGQKSFSPDDILMQDWFMENVTLNREAAGAVRSLLGHSFHLPVWMANHREEAPFSNSNWHIDGNYVFSPELNYLQVFYYPQDTPVELGPTHMVPGSHLIRNAARCMAHLGNIAGAVPTAAPAGSIFLTVYQIWHRRGKATATGTRNLLKYNYWRTTPPLRDWIREDDFNFATANYRSPVDALAEQLRPAVSIAEMFLWLCGELDKFQNLGGASWPVQTRGISKPYGLPGGLGV